MRVISTIVPAASLLLVAAWYHATIETDLASSSQVNDNQWASSWIYGLVPPKVVETAERCPNGVSRVETQLSFVNQLVGFLTLGIYTPMSIRVTCAQGDRPRFRPGGSKSPWT